MKDHLYAAAATIITWVLILIMVLVLHLVLPAIVDWLSRVSDYISSHPSVVIMVTSLVVTHVRAFEKSFSATVIFVNQLNSAGVLPSPSMA
jgi:hypothetical protein